MIGRNSAGTEALPLQNQRRKTMRKPRRPRRGRRPHPPRLLAAPALENQGGVSAAEAKGVRERIFQIYFAGYVRDVIEIALGIGSFLIDSGRQRLITQGQNQDACFQTSGSDKQMAGHGLGAADGNLFVAVTEYALERTGFNGFAWRRCRVWG